MSLSSQLNPEPDPKDSTPSESDSSAVSTEPSLLGSQSQVTPTETVATEQPVVETVPSPVTTPVAPSLQITEAPQPKSEYDQITDFLLGQIGDIGSKENLKLGIYSEPGGTKSSFAGTAPNNLVIDLEDGLIAAKTAYHHSGRPMAPNVKAFPYSKFLGAEELVKRFADHHPALESFDVLTIDTISDMHKRELQGILDREWARRPDSVNRFNPDTVEDNVYTEVNQMLSHFMRTLRELDRDLIILAHAQTVEPRGKPAKTYFDFSEKLTNKLMAMMDIVGYMSWMEVPDSQGNAVRKPTIRFHTEGTIYCKTRIPLPELVVDPTFPEIKAEWDKARLEGNVAPQETE